MKYGPCGPIICVCGHPHYIHATTEDTTLYDASIYSNFIMPSYGPCSECDCQRFSRAIPRIASFRNIARRMRSV